MGKIIYIIPGFKQSPKSKGFKELSNMFTQRGINPVIVKIDWKRKVMSDYVEEFLQENPAHGKYVIGFSFGAMIALIAAEKIKPKLLILCSLSPYFKEDLRKRSRHWIDVRVGKKRLKDFQDYSFNKIAAKIKCRTLILVGEKEIGIMHPRAKDANRKLKNSKLVVVPKARHKISQKEYQEALKNLVYKL